MRTRKSGEFYSTLTTRSSLPFLRALPGYEFQRNRIQTVSQAGRGRSVGKNVSEVSVTPGARYFGPMHAVARVFYHLDILLVDRLKKTGPAGSRLEFGVRCKKR